MSQRVIHVGIGVWGKRWCREFLKTNVEDGTIEVAALVDVDPEALAHGRALLGVPAERCFTDARRAFAETPADFCSVVVQPADHEAVIDLAIEYGIDILCEKPLTDSMEAAVRIARKIRRSGRKLAVTMSHRYDQDKTTLRRIVRSGVLGRVNAIGCRFLGDMRQHMAWSSLFRHTMRDPLMVEGAVHHLDIIADLAGSRCRTVYANTWRPDWAEYAGDSDGIVVMEFENGVRAVYEGSVSHPVGLNTFYKEYIRVDGERGTAILTHGDVEVFARQDIWRQQNREGRGQKIVPLIQPKWINNWLIELFARWRDGGPMLETEIEGNLQSCAMMFGAIDSQRTGRVVNVQDFIASFNQAKDRVRV